VEANVYSVYSEGGPPAIELVQSVPGTPLAGNGGVSFHHLGFWTDRLADSSHDLDAHGWAVRSKPWPAPESNPSRFSLQQSPHGFYVELFDTATPRPRRSTAKRRAWKGQTMNTARELQTAQTGDATAGTHRTHPSRGGQESGSSSRTRPIPVAQTITALWYDDYEHAIIRPGLLAKRIPLRETQTRLGRRPTHAYAAILRHREPRIRHRPGPAIEKLAGLSERTCSTIREAASSRQRSAASYALTGSLEADGDPRRSQPVCTSSSPTVGLTRWREQRAAALLKTGFFSPRFRDFRIIEGDPEPPAWLEVFETDLQATVDRVCASVRCPGVPTTHRRSSSTKLAARSSSSLPTKGGLAFGPRKGGASGAEVQVIVKQ